MKVNAKQHTATLIGSIRKELRNARRKGTYSFRELYFLNCISKTLSFSCQIGMTEEQQRELSIFYFRILSIPNKFCVHEFETEYYKKIENANDLFVQTKDSGSTSAPEVDDFLIGEPLPGGIFNEKFNNLFD